MSLNEYYSKIIEKYKSKDFKILRFNDLPLPKVREPHLEAQHFMMYEWCEEFIKKRFGLRNQAGGYIWKFKK